MVGPCCCSREQALGARSFNTNSIKPLVKEITRIVYDNGIRHGIDWQYALNWLDTRIRKKAFMGLFIALAT